MAFWAPCKYRRGCLFITKPIQQIVRQCNKQMWELKAREPDSMTIMRKKWDTPHRYTMQALGSRRRSLIEQYRRLQRIILEARPLGQQYPGLTAAAGVPALPRTKKQPMDLTDTVAPPTLRLARRAASLRLLGTWHNKTSVTAPAPSHRSSGSAERDCAVLSLWCRAVNLSTQCLNEHHSRRGPRSRLAQQSSHTRQTDRDSMSLAAATLRGRTEPTKTASRTC